MNYGIDVNGERCLVERVLREQVGLKKGALIILINSFQKATVLKKFTVSNSE